MALYGVCSVNNGNDGSLRSILLVLPEVSSVNSVGSFVYLLLNANMNVSFGADSDCSLLRT